MKNHHDIPESKSYQDILESGPRISSYLYKFLLNNPGLVSKAYVISNPEAIPIVHTEEMIPKVQPFSANQTEGLRTISVKEKRLTMQKKAFVTTSDLKERRQYLSFDNYLESIAYTLTGYIRRHLDSEIINIHIQAGNIQKIQDEKHPHSPVSVDRLRKNILVMRSTADSQNIPQLDRYMAMDIHTKRKLLKNLTEMGYGEQNKPYTVTQENEAFCAYFGFMPITYGPLPYRNSFLKPLDNPTKLYFGHTRSSFMYAGRFEVYESHRDYFPKVNIKVKEGVYSFGVALNYGLMALSPSTMLGLELSS